MDSSTVKTLNVSSSQVVSINDFAKLEASDYVYQESSYDLPMGSILYMNAPRFSAVIMPSKNSRSLVRFGFLDTNNGEVTDALTTAVSAGDDYQLYDFRANDSIAIWVEVKFSTSAWCVYSASVNGSHVLGTPNLVETGTVDYDPPLLCVSGNQAFYTVLPYENGPKSTTSSYLKCISTDSSSPSIVYTSPGRMITNPQASDNIVTFVPRVNTSGVYYQLSAMDATTHALVAAQVLPKALKVNDALYLNNDFIFGIEQNYSTGDGISNFGTYRAIGNNNYMRFNKVPSDTPAAMGDFLYIKSARSIVGVNPAKRTYFIIDVVSDCASYGDYLATTGNSDRIVTFTTVADNDGSGDGVTKVRVFKSM